MYALTPGQKLCLVYEDFYLAIVNTFYEFINIDGVVKSLHLLRYGLWPDVRHTTCMPSRLAKNYALNMKIST